MGIGTSERAIGATAPPMSFMESLSKVNPKILLEAREREGSGSSKAKGEVTSSLANPLRESEFVLQVPMRQPPEVSSFEREQTFDGLVLAVSPDARSFVARLVDATWSQPDEEAEFELREIAQDDRHLVVPGALFTWHIGLQSRHRQLQRVSDIRFRRLPPASQASLQRAASAGAALSERLRIQNERAESWADAN